MLYGFCCIYLFPFLLLYVTISFSFPLLDWVAPSQSDSCDGGVSCGGDSDSQEAATPCQHSGSDILLETYAFA